MKPMNVVYNGTEGCGTVCEAGFGSQAVATLLRCI
jgi:hypothetical protein